MKGKNSFVLYTDLHETVKQLPDNKAGILFKTILSYVNDENPVVKDLVVKIAFEPIKLQLKRDLKKWEAYQQKQSENGKRGGRPKKDEPLADNPENPTLIFDNPTKPKKADTVPVTVPVNVTIKKGRGVFTPPTLAEVVDYFFESGYTKSSGEKAFKYYNDAGWKDSKGNKVRNWKQKMQGVWFKDENKITTTGNRVAL